MGGGSRERGRFLGWMTRKGAFSGTDYAKGCGFGARTGAAREALDDLLLVQEQLLRLELLLLQQVVLVLDLVLGVGFRVQGFLRRF